MTMEPFSHTNQFQCSDMRSAVKYTGKRMLRFIGRSLLLSIVFLIPSCGGEFEILLDSVDSPATLYWAETGKTIHSIRIDGTRRKTLLNRPGLPLGMAVYSPGGKIYWTEFT